MSHVKAGQPQSAAPLLARAAKTPKGNLAAEIAFQLADVHLTMKKYPEAARSFQAFLKQFGKHKQAHEALYNLTYCAYAQNRFTEARDHAQAFFKTFASSALADDVRLLLGHSQSALKDYDGGIATFTALTKTVKGAALDSAWFNLANCHYLKGEWGKALAAAGRIKTRDASNPDAVAARFIAGECAFNIDDFDRAIAEFSVLLKADPKSRHIDTALLRTGQSHLKKKRPTEAAATFKDLVARAPKSPHVVQAHYQLAEIAFAAKDYATAAAEYDAVVKGDAKSPFHPFSLEGAAWCAYRRKDLPRAAALFAKSAVTHPKHALAIEARYMHGRVLHEAGRFAERTATISPAPSPTSRRSSAATSRRTSRSRRCTSSGGATGRPGPSPRP